MRVYSFIRYLRVGLVPKTETHIGQYFRNKKFQLQYGYLNWTLVSVPDTQTWFWSHTSGWHAWFNQATQAQWQLRWLNLTRYFDTNKRCQITLLGRKFEFPAQNTKQLIQVLCSVFCWQWDIQK